MANFIDLAIWSAGIACIVISLTAMWLLHEDAHRGWIFLGVVAGILTIWLAPRVSLLPVLWLALMGGILLAFLISASKRQNRFYRTGFDFGKATMPPPDLEPSPPGTHSILGDLVRNAVYALLTHNKASNSPPVGYWSVVFPNPMLLNQEHVVKVNFPPIAMSARSAAELRASAVPRMRLAELRRKILQHFSEEELRTLCFDIGIDYSDLAGEGREAKTRELLAYLARSSRVGELVKKCIEERPHVEWESAIDEAALARSSTFSDSSAIPLSLEEDSADDWLTLIYAALRESPDEVVISVVPLAQSFQVQPARRDIVVMTDRRLTAEFFVTPTQSGRHPIRLEVYLGKMQLGWFQEIVRVRINAQKTLAMLGAAIGIVATALSILSALKLFP